MAYNKTTWVNGETPVNAENMNNIENGISSLDTNKLDKSDVVNTTTESASNGKALNAVQANPSITGTLAQQINVFLERGYVRPTFVGTDSISTLSTGFYSKWVATGELPAFDQFNFIRLQGQDPDFISTIGIHPVRGDVLVRGNDSDTWQQIATTTMIELSSNLLNGWTTVNGFQKPYAIKVGNLVSIVCRITGGSTSLPCNLIQLPSELRPLLPSKGFANNDLKFAEVNINPDGTITCTGVSGGTMTNGSFAINMTYVI